MFLYLDCYVILLRKLRCVYFLFVGIVIFSKTGQKYFIDCEDLVDQMFKLKCSSFPDYINNPKNAQYNSDIN